MDSLPALHLRNTAPEDPDHAAERQNRILGNGTVRLPPSCPCGAAACTPSAVAL